MPNYNMINVKLVTGKPQRSYGDLEMVGKV